jgi:membrane protease YdiL (CAAX protease family)
MSVQTSERAARGAGPARHPWRILEPLVFVSLALAYIWVVQPTRDDWLRVPFLALIVIIPFVSNYVHRDRPKDLGLRVDNLAGSMRDVAVMTLAAAIAVVGIGLLAGTTPVTRPGIARSIVLYPFWGLAQQYAMQSFTYRRLREGVGQPGIAAALAASLFAAAHYPNLALAVSTLIGGFFWCLLFQRTPNLITLALSHGWLAVLLRASWPSTWLHNLRIGPSFWTWGP